MVEGKISFKDRVKYNIVFVLLLLMFLGSFIIIGFSPLVDYVDSLFSILWA